MQQREAPSANGGSNPVLVWCINHSVEETLCCNAKHPMAILRFLYVPAYSCVFKQQVLFLLDTIWQGQECKNGCGSF